MQNPVRRVVTGYDENGASIIVSDSAADNVVYPIEGSELALINLWKTNETPSKIHDNNDKAKTTFALEPDANGTIFRMVDFPPEGEKSDAPELTQEALDAIWQSIGADRKKVQDDNPSHPFMHYTSTVDYAVIISGEITMLIDNDEVDLKAGDVIVQRGTNHAWVNRSDQMCRIMFVLVDADVKRGKK